MLGEGIGAKTTLDFIHELVLCDWPCLGLQKQFSVSIIVRVDWRRWQGAVSRLLGR
jgi:hypothetical protein